MTADTVLQVDNLVKDFPISHGGARRMLRAVDDITFTVAAGETVAVVGESGSGKSTLARCIARLVEPTAGSVTVGTTQLQRLSRRQVRAAYSQLQMVFQDPNSSLNPRMTVRAILDEPLRLHTDLDAAARDMAVRKALQDVDLDPVVLNSYPRRLSGGQRQRIGIARALAVDPRIILLDEPTASLDVSVRGRILQLLRRVQRERRLGYVLISHDLQLVRAVADRVLVVYLGAVVEQGPAAEVLGNPVHPYTRALLSAAPSPTIGHRPPRLRLIGEAPSPLQRPQGCRLAGRCPYAEPTCHTTRPALLPVSDDHRAACPVVLNSRADEGAPPTA